MSQIALFIGRFQPFHLGHLSVIQDILTENTHLVIGIGSSQYSKTNINPYTYEEREAMIRAALKEANISLSKITIIAIPDIHDSEKWVKHVQNLTPPFSALYTGSPVVCELFEQSNNTTIKPVNLTHKISATQIRDRMKNGEKWNHLVPPAVAKLA
jgi:nicotinamide-nucleotide adenylyltransferase